MSGNDSTPETTAYQTLRTLRDDAGLVADRLESVWETAEGNDDWVEADALFAFRVAEARWKALIDATEAVRQVMRLPREDLRPRHRADTGTVDRSPGQEEALAHALRSHHAAMLRQLDRLTEAMLAEDRGQAAKAALEDWLETFLLPHVAEEEATVYTAAAELKECRVLVAALRRDHMTISALAGHCRDTRDLAVSAGYARSLFHVLQVHQALEDDMLVPALIASSQVSLTELLVQAEHLHAEKHPEAVGS